MPALRDWHLSGRRMEEFLGVKREIASEQLLPGGSHDLWLF